MASKYWYDGFCFACNDHTYYRCDNCTRFVCEFHSRFLKKGNTKLDICDTCWKHVKADVKIDGVRITKKMLV